MTGAQGVVDREKKIVMAKLRFEGRERWLLPGGSVDQGESPEQPPIKENLRGNQY